MTRARESHARAGSGCAVGHVDDGPRLGHAGLVEVALPGIAVRRVLLLGQPRPRRLVGRADPGVVAAVDDLGGGSAREFAGSTRPAAVTAPVDGKPASTSNPPSLIRYRANGGPDGACRCAVIAAAVSPNAAPRNAGRSCGST